MKNATSKKKNAKSKNNVTSRVKVNDKVKVIAGRDKGKVSKVTGILRGSSRVIVEDVNIVQRHTKPTSSDSKGGIIKKAAPINLSNVMPMCSSCLKPTRIRMKILEDNSKVRVCVKCNEIFGA